MKNPFNLTEEQVSNNQAWIEALRSGDYQQTRRAMCSNLNEFCCLGVACKIKNLDSIPQEGIFYFPVGDGKEEQETGYPQDRWFVEQYGFSFTRLIVRLEKHAPYALANLNDALGLNFEEIADILEKYLFTNHHEIQIPRLASGNLFTFMRQ